MAILFVVDNSEGTQDIQRTLVASAASLTDPLNAAGIDYRIGVTTTSGPNPACPDHPTTAGELVATSCRGRADAFVTDTQEDHTAACTDGCALDALDILPTDIGDGVSRSRPWLEVRGGESNVGNASVAETLACLLPQGVNGCEFESPLEAMLTGFGQADTSEAAGFQSADARAVVMVTNELDCSHYMPESDIFLPSGAKTFWPDPSAPKAASAVCWNAGVECEGGPGTYTDCQSASRDALGRPTVEASGVLLAVNRYIQFWQDWEVLRGGTHPKARAIVAAIAGVPPGYPANPMVYADTSDAGFQGEYGIGPVCSGTGGGAVPSVRIRETVAGLPGDPLVSSVCDASYGPALAAVADRIIDQRPDGCLPYCVADMDDNTAGVQPQCGFELGVGNPIPLCVGSPGAWDPPFGAEACYWYSDPAGCLEKGLNARVNFVAAAGVSLAEWALAFVCVEDPTCPA